MHGCKAVLDFIRDVILDLRRRRGMRREDFHPVMKINKNICFDTLCCGFQETFFLL